MPYHLSFTDSDLVPLQGLLDELFVRNNVLFERLIEVLSRLGLRVKIQSTIQLYPMLEVVKKEVVNTLKKGLSHVQKK